MSCKMKVHVRYKYLNVHSALQLQTVQHQGGPSGAPRGSTGRHPPPGPGCFDGMRSALLWAAPAETDDGSGRPAAVARVSSCFRQVWPRSFEESRVHEDGTWW